MWPCLPLVSSSKHAVSVLVHKLCMPNPSLPGHHKPQTLRPLSRYPVAKTPWAWLSGTCHLTSAGHLSTAFSPLLLQSPAGLHGGVRSAPILDNVPCTMCNGPGYAGDTTNSSRCGTLSAWYVSECTSCHPFRIYVSTSTTQQCLSRLLAHIAPPSLQLLNFPIRMAELDHAKIREDCKYILRTLLFDGTLIDNGSFIVAPTL